MSQRNFLLVYIRRTYLDTHSQAGSKIFYNERATKCVSLLHGFNKQKRLISCENLSHAAISIFLQRGCPWESKYLSALHGQQRLDINNNLFDIAILHDISGLNVKNGRINEFTI